MFFTDQKKLKSLVDSDAMNTDQTKQHVQRLVQDGRYFVTTQVC